MKKIDHEIPLGVLAAGVAAFFLVALGVTLAVLSWTATPTTTLYCSDTVEIRLIGEHIDDPGPIQTYLCARLPAVHFGTPPLTSGGSAT